ncbi:hypothetical protein KIL84_008676 [Mauremys mutica]|uniref:Uncharacterized protein n=1 Tax=Mauremys mutica TaxID=74926 RepID=A0A9D3X8K5_9SAUR|nr:hypothetical protein KIL84_008676 [Mauremys mutica]
MDLAIGGIGMRKGQAPGAIHASGTGMEGGTKTRVGEAGGQAASSSEQRGVARDHSGDISRSGFMQSLKGKNENLELSMGSRGSQWSSSEHCSSTGFSLYLFL